MKVNGSVMAAALILVMAPCFTPGQFGGDEGGSFSLVGSARAEESWKQEFDEVCGKSEESMSMSLDDLKALIARCEKLKPFIEAQEETVRKVYLKRLQMCRDLLAYVLEVKSRN